MCIGVHKQLSKALGIKEEEIEEVSKGVDALSCSNEEKNLLRFCIRASKKDNYKITKNEIDEVKASGYSEKEILEAVAIVAYFNYINTLSNTFGLGSE